MKNYRHAKVKRPTERVSFYIALSICMMAVGFAVWTAYSTLSDTTDPSDNTYFSSLSTENAAVGQEMTGVTVEATEAVTEPPTEEPTEEMTEPARKLVISETKPTEARSANQNMGSDQLQAVLNVENSLIYPVKSGQVTKPYSEDAVYSKTLRDYRAHVGCDFAADEGENVYAMCDGTVSDISVSELYGVIIEADCGDCYVYYCGLDSQLTVEKGQQLSTGDTIGTVARIPCENEDEPHVHIEIRSGNRTIDPLSVIESDS